SCRLLCGILSASLVAGTATPLSGILLSASVLLSGGRSGLSTRSRSRDHPDREPTTRGNAEWSHVHHPTHALGTPPSFTRRGCRPMTARLGTLLRRDLWWFREQLPAHLIVREKGEVSVVIDCIGVYPVPMTACKAAAIFVVLLVTAVGAGDINHPTGTNGVLL